jgi:hypothetical protein
MILLSAPSVWALDFTPLENRIFDENKTDPRGFLVGQYEAAQVLALGETNHSQFRVYEHLINLLKSVGMDPKLRFIVLERSQDFDRFYEELSLRHQNEVLKKGLFASAMEQESAICKSFPANPYLVVRFFPILRKINERRQDAGLKPVLVKAIDIPYSLFYSAPPYSVQPGNCKLPLSVPARIEESQDRESLVADNFKFMIWNQLEGQKAIVLYHIGHLIQGFDACLPKIKVDHWETSLAPMNWLNLYFKNNPKHRTRFQIIAMDEREARGSQAPEGLFQFSKRQSDRIPSESFGVALKSFGPLQWEASREVFMKASVMRHYQGGMIRSPLDLSRMIDGLVWSADADEYFVLKRPNEYLPDLCH